MMQKRLGNVNRIILKILFRNWKIITIRLKENNMIFQAWMGDNFDFSRRQQYKMEVS